MKTFLTKCPCGRTTSKSYARVHGGKCKACVNPEQAVKRDEARAERRQGMIIDHGYEGYAREEGHYDLPDYA